VMKTQPFQFGFYQHLAADADHVFDKQFHVLLSAER